MMQIIVPQNMGISILDDSGLFNFIISCGAANCRSTSLPETDLTPAGLFGDDSKE
jgi:hypothetical protein